MLLRLYCRDYARLRALGRSREFLFHCNGQVTHGDVRDSPRIRAPLFHRRFTTLWVRFRFSLPDAVQEFNIVPLPATCGPGQYRNPRQGQRDDYQDQQKVQHVHEFRSFYRAVAACLGSGGSPGAPRGFMVALALAPPDNEVAPWAALPLASLASSS